MIIALLSAFIGACLGLYALELFLRWIAAGEPDSNGDPERDGGVYGGDN